MRLAARRRSRRHGARRAKGGAAADLRRTLGEHRDGVPYRGLDACGGDGVDAQAGCAFLGGDTGEVEQLVVAYAAGLLGIQVVAIDPRVGFDRDRRVREVSFAPPLAPSVSRSYRLKRWPPTNLAN